MLRRSYEETNCIVDISNIGLCVAHNMGVECYIRKFAESDSWLVCLCICNVLLEVWKMTVKDYALKKIMEILEHKCPVIHNVQQRKIYYPVGMLNTIKSDITDPLLALYYFFMDKEDKHWRENLYEEWTEDLKYHFVKDKKKKVYLSGQITGLSEEEYKKNFNEAELYLTGLGFDVVNPVSYTPIPNGSWTDYMRRDIKLLMDCDYIYMLDNWTESTGAKAEFRLAVEIGIERLKLDT